MGLLVFYDLLFGEAMCISKNKATKNAIISN